MPDPARGAVAPGGTRILDPDAIRALDVSDAYIEEVTQKELVELDLRPGAGLDALLAATRPAPRRDLDVDDPMGMPFGAYERTVGELQDGIDVLVKLLCD